MYNILYEMLFFLFLKEHYTSGIGNKIFFSKIFLIPRQNKYLSRTWITYAEPTIHDSINDSPVSNWPLPSKEV